MATQTQLDHIQSLETAYEKLISGAKAAVVVDSTGEWVEWQAASRIDLRKYIAEKKIEYGIIKAARPLGVFF